HIHTQQVDQALRAATTAVDLAATTQSERVLSRVRQFRRSIPADSPRVLLRDFDDRVRAANTRERSII
ncbi:MAG TPA: hypothetical protein VGJ13_15460, partial [Pseudonocardiaceae bacterium]